MRGSARIAAAAFLLVSLALVAAACEDDDPGGGDVTGGEDVAGLGFDDAPAAAAPVDVGPPAPLTGVPTTDPAVAERASVAVSLAGAAQAGSLVGITEADLVFVEPVAEGERYLAVFHSALPESVGPVATASVIDAALVRPLAGMLAGLSPNDTMLDLLRYADVVLREEGQPFDAWVREPSLRAPYNVFVQPRALLDATSEPSEPPQPTWEVDVEGPRDGVAARQVALVRPSGRRVSWEWDAGTSRWRRSEPAVSAASVVLVAVPSMDGFVAGPAAATTTGEGAALLLGEGRAVEGRWSRQPGEAFSWTTADGEAIPLRPGPVWIELVPSEGAAETVPATVG